LPDTYMADISEWQTSFDAPAYISGGYKIVIVRAYSGYRADSMMPSRRDYVRGQPFVGVGYYCYLAKDVDPKTQANGFINTIGTLRDNEWAILDVEEGSGSQTSRAEAWFSVVDKWAGSPAMIYASSSFMDSQLSGCGHWSGRSIWLAAYPGSYTDNPAVEPSGRHDLWQYTDRRSMPGLSGGVDCSVHRGDEQSFMNAVLGGKAPTPPPPEDYMAIAAALNAGESLHVFVEAKDGSIWYTYQSKGKTAWNGGQSGKKIAGLVKFAPAPGK
jgi:GH25 family lysozyme M1 (1,4-beta-N-acetylmuramidase)